MIRSVTMASPALRTTLSPALAALASLALVAPRAAPAQEPPPPPIVTAPAAQPAPALQPAPAAQPATASRPEEDEPPPLVSDAVLSGPDVNELQLAFGAGVSTGTIQVDGAAATGFLPQFVAGFRHNLLLTTVAFDLDASETKTAATDGIDESRSGWHLGASIGPSFPISSRARLDLNLEMGIHRLEESTTQGNTAYSTYATLPFVGLRPALSIELGSGRTRGALGLAAFFRVDVPQKQPSGLPDDGGHELGVMAFLAVKLALGQ